MYGHYALEQSFEDLLSYFAEEKVLSFAQDLFPYCGTLTVTYRGELDRFIYTHGDSLEVYSTVERKLASAVQRMFVLSGRDRDLGRTLIPCRFVVVDMTRSQNVVHDCILLMKMISKTIPGFNQYIFVAHNYVHLGCDLLGNGNGLDCKLSYLIQQGINWEQLLVLFSYIPETNDFKPFYYEVVSALETVGECYVDNEDPMLAYDYVQSDEMESSYARGFDWRQVDSFGKPSDTSKNESAFTEFKNDVAFYLEQLRFIKPNRVNPFEVLFDAEHTELTEEQVSDASLELTEDMELDPKVEALLDDPTQLIKYLSKKAETRRD